MLCLCVGTVLLCSICESEEEEEEVAAAAVTVVCRLKLTD